MRQGRREQLRVAGTVNLLATEAEGGGTRVIEARKISKSFGDKQIVIDFSTRIVRGNRIGVVGANGAGKTTLVNLLTGKLAPDSGKLRIGVNVQMAALDQNRLALHPDDMVAAVLTGGSGDTIQVGGQPRQVVSYRKDFLFTPAQARTPVGACCRAASGHG